MRKVDGELMDAVQSSSLIDVRKALSMGANVNVQDEEEEERYTPLAYAVMNFGYPETRAQDLEILRELLKRGANPNTQLGDGVGTVLHQAPHFACYQLEDETMIDGIDVVKELVDHGANLKALDAAGKTPIMQSQKRGCVAMTEFLRSREQEQDVARRGVAEISTIGKKDLPIEISKKIVGYVAGRKTKSKRKITRRKKQQKRTRRRR